MQKITSLSITMGEFIRANPNYELNVMDLQFCIQIIAANFDKVISAKNAEIDKIKQSVNVRDAWLDDLLEENKFLMKKLNL